MNEIPALFVSYAPFLADGGGGVQLCTREYRQSLEAAGFALDAFPFELGRSPWKRIIRRIAPEVSLLSSAALPYEQMRQRVMDGRAQFVFFNHTPFPQLSKRLALDCPWVKQVLLSHGVDAIDFLIAQTVGRRIGNKSWRGSAADRMLGQTLFAEAHLRPLLHAVLTLSSFEDQFERWLGARKVLWVPRSVARDELEWRPVDGRVGCVSTLDHPPNLTGLVDLFEILKDRIPSHFEFRLIGQPREEGERLSMRYPFVRYLGPLGDPQMRSEAASWCCFVHPLFVLAKGCSTKLATPLGWGIPIATTDTGARGYVWDETRLPLAHSPGELARFVLERSSVAHCGGFRAQTKQIADLAPSIEKIGRQLREFLLARAED